MSLNGRQVFSEHESSVLISLTVQRSLSTPFASSCNPTTSEFAGRFLEFCRGKGITPLIDLLFIDTSHYYEHTVQEIKAWLPFVSARGKVIFHDTNLKVLGPRRDGCFQLSWDNQRGVIRAIEEYLGVAIDENKDFSDQFGDWMVRHWPNCNGLTIMDRIA